jgi:hypothetical protein
MSQPLRSAPITGASALLRAGPPACAATVLSTSPFQRLGVLPLASRILAGRSIDARLPVFPHASRRPGSRHLHAGHRLASNAGFRQAHPGAGIIAPVLMPSSPLGASAVVHSRSPSRSPPDGSHVRLFRIAQHDSLQLTHHAVAWHHPPQGGAEGPRNLHLTCSYDFKSSPPTAATPFRAHGAKCRVVKGLGRRSRFFAGVCGVLRVRAGAGR